jgi:cellulose biosynthesis protein BcsQ
VEGTPVTITLAVANQKGGVAKTTTVASLGAALAELGQSVLLVDLDPQACLTFSLGLDPDALELSVHDVLLGRVPAAMALLETDEGMTLLPAAIDLTGSEARLVTRGGREFVLREALAEVGAAFDWVILDCSPSLGVLTLNALTAADAVVIPLQCETLSHRGVGQLLETIDEVRKRTQAAIQRKVHPKKWTYANIERMRTQLRSMGAIFDWEREAVSSDPASMLPFAMASLMCVAESAAPPSASASQSLNSDPWSRPRGTGIGSPASTGTPRVSLAARYFGGSDRRGRRPLASAAARSMRRVRSSPWSASAGSRSGRESRMTCHRCRAESSRFSRESA